MKQQLRNIILKKRKEIINNDLMIVENLKKILNDFNKILIYYPIYNEPNILELVNIFKEKQFYLPYTYPKHIEIRKLTDLNDLEKDLYNVPSSKTKTNDEVEVAVVPSLAMNKDMYRLGYGKGYYDKFLKNKNILKIAVVNSDFVIEEKYQDDWDIRFDIIVTEKEIIKLGV